MPKEEPLINPAAEGISRRKMLNRIGAGTAVAWSAPILTSIHTSAFAASPGCSCPPFDCANPQLCNDGCPCTPHHNGGPCICWSTGTCFSGQPTCQTDQDCINNGFGGVCGDVNPDCGCFSDNTACFDSTGCANGNFTGKWVLRHV